MKIEVFFVITVSFLAGWFGGYKIRSFFGNTKQNPIKEPTLEVFKPKPRYWTVSYKRNNSLLGEVCTIIAPTKQIAIEEAYKSLKFDYGKNGFAITKINEFVFKENDNEKNVD